MVIFSGYDESGNNTVNTDLEVFTPSANLNGVGTVSSSRPPSQLRVYPHLFVLPRARC